MRYVTLVKPNLKRPLCSVAGCQKSTSQIHQAVDVEASDADTLQVICSSFRIFKNFISEAEEETLFNEVERHLKRAKYEFDHWDNVQTRYPT